MNENAPYAPLAVPIADYGITSFSRPLASVLLGLATTRTLNKGIAAGAIVALGRVKQQITTDEIERVQGRPVTIGDYLNALKTMNLRRRPVAVTRNQGPNGSRAAIENEDAPRDPPLAA